MTEWTITNPNLVRLWWVASSVPEVYQDFTPRYVRVLGEGHLQQAPGTNVRTLSVTRGNFRVYIDGDREPVDRKVTRVIFSGGTLRANQIGRPPLPPSRRALSQRLVDKVGPRTAIQVLGEDLWDYDF